MKHLCRLCLASSETTIDVFSESGKSLNISSIVSQYFWFHVFNSLFLYFRNAFNINMLQILENDAVSTLVCSNCWINTYNFHLFYGNVKKAQTEFFNDSSTFEEFKDILNPITETSEENDIKYEISPEDEILYSDSDAIQNSCKTEPSQVPSKEVYLEIVQICKNY